METEIYKIPVSHYVQNAATRLIGRWWWAVAIPMAVLLFAGMGDWRWWVVALGIICVILPGVAMLTFYYYVLSPEAVRCIMPQRAIMLADGIKIVYYPLQKADEDKPASWTPEPRVIKAQQVSSCVTVGPYTIIKLQDGEEVEIPRSAQPKDMDLQSFFSQNGL